MKPLAFKILTLLLLLGVFALLIYLALPIFKDALHDQLVQAVMLSLTDEERQAITEELADATSGLWDAIPDPRVARIAKRDIVATLAEAEVRTNNAGFRSSRPFAAKAPDTFRIVCLGDSFVLGHGGLEEDRFCDQIEAFYRDQGITASGQAIETYALGISGWTAVQEATYLSTRLSAYEPDVILVLTVANDITSGYGVTGHGTNTIAFSPEVRQLGSGAFSATAGGRFKFLGETALSTDVCPEARSRWHQAMGALRRLSVLQTQRGGKILNSVSVGKNHRSIYFAEMYKRFYAEAGPETPFVVTSFFRDDQTKLAHDSHPNRQGHAIFAHHYIHMLDQLGWVPVPEDRLPPLDPRLSLETNPAPDLETLEFQRSEFIRVAVYPTLDFSNLDRRRTMGFLGGILPDQRRRRVLEAPPWASVQSGFLLRHLSPAQPAKVVVHIRIPPRVELFPMRIEMMLDGRPVGTFDFAEPGDRFVLEAPLPASGEAVAEVILRTDSYFSGITDQRMKSFQLLSAEIQESDNG